MLLTRRSVLAGLIGAPTIAIASNLMPLRGLIMPRMFLYQLSARDLCDTVLTETRSETWVNLAMHETIQDTVRAQARWSRELGNTDIIPRPEAYANKTSFGGEQQMGWGIGTLANDILMHRAKLLLPHPNSYGWKFIE